MSRGEIEDIHKIYTLISVKLINIIIKKSAFTMQFEKELTYMYYTTYIFLSVLAQNYWLF